jgi:hypothetical protein
MTMPNERTHAVIRTQRFLLALLQTPISKWDKKAIRKEIASCLRHYPSALDFTSQDLDSFEFGAQDLGDENREKQIEYIIKVISKEVVKK